jgi:hypothetical protein
MKNPAARALVLALVFALATSAHSKPLHLA